MDVFNPETVAQTGIERMEAFFISMGLGTRLSELAIPADRIDDLATKCTNSGKRTFGNFVKLGYEDVRKIFNLASDQCLKILKYYSC